MLLINLAINLFSILKVGALECVSVVNQKCMPRPKILNVNEGIGETLLTFLIIYGDLLKIKLIRLLK